MEPADATAERFRLAAEAVDGLIYDADLATGRVVRTRGLFALVGYRPDEVPPTVEWWSTLIHPADAPDNAARFAAALAAGHDRVLSEYRVRHRDGRWRHVEDRAALVRDDAGTLVRLVGCTQDVTARRASEARFRFLDAVTQATRALDDPGAVMAATTRLLGEHLGVTRCAYADVEADNDAFTIRDDWSTPGVPTSAGTYRLDLFGSRAVAAMRTGRPLVVADVDGELTAADGADTFNSIGIKAIVCFPLLKGGRLAAMMAVHSGVPRAWTAEDVALVGETADRSWAHIERVRFAAALRDADRRKDEFLATLAHELRNPLAPLRTGLELLRTGDPATEPARAMMERQLGQMVRLVDDLLDVSRITRGKLDLRRARVAVRAVVEAGVETARPTIDAAGHTLTVAADAGGAAVDGDATRLSQVVANLLTNAAKYTPPGGTIAVTATADGEEVVVRVADTGIGIPPAMLGRVFDLFEQVDRRLEKTTGGLGIGLSLVKGIVEMHGGLVAAVSAGEGRGSTFEVRLPRAVGAAAEEAVEPTPPGAAGRRRVLVVDDNVDAAEALGQLLGRLGHDVRTAHDGAAGVAAAAAFRPDVVLMDLGMPRLNGFDAARQMRAAPWGRDVALVALTGWGQDGDRRRSREAGFDHHLVKPVDPRALLALLAGGAA